MDGRFAMSGYLGRVFGGRQLGQGCVSLCFAHTLCVDLRGAGRLAAATEFGLLVLFYFKSIMRRA